MSELLLLLQLRCFNLCVAFHSAHVYCLGGAASFSGCNPVLCVLPALCLRPWPPLFKAAIFNARIVCVAAVCAQAAPFTPGLFGCKHYYDLSDTICPGFS